MNLFCLVTAKGGEGERFLQAATPLFAQDKVEVFRDVETFAERLRKPRDPSCAVLAVGPSHGDMRRIVSLREFLKDARILLVLDDQNEETISLVHKTLPTYISYLDNGTAGIVTVLKQVMKGSGVKEMEP
jgi:hypothetical protein